MDDRPMFEDELQLIKAGMAQRLFEQFDLNVAEALEVVDRFYGEIAKSFATGESVELARWGFFSLRDGFSSTNLTPTEGH